MEHNPWLVKEVRLITSDLHEMRNDLRLIPAKFKMGMSDSDSTVVIGDHEWSLISERLDDACDEIVAQLNAYIDNDFNRQLHWSALRMLTAHGVFSVELQTLHDRLEFIVADPGTGAESAEGLIKWLDVRVQPAARRISARILQVISRVLDPESWEVQGGLSGSNADLDLTLRFRPNTLNRSREQRERERELRRVRL